MRSVIVVVALIVLWGIHRKWRWSARESPEALKTMPYNTRVAMSLAVSVAAMLTGDRFWRCTASQGFDTR